MSGSSSIPKRSHEEASALTPLKRSVDEGGGLHNSPLKPSQPSIFQSNVSTDPGFDGRSVKLQKTQAHDKDKRLPSFPLDRMSSSANSFSDHPISHDVKEIQEDRADSKEEETNARVLISDPRMDTSVNKTVIESKQDTNGEKHLDLKSESRLENEGVGLNESKEHHKSKRLSEALREVAEEVRMEVFIGGERENLERQEVVGENQIDVKDREKKKKDENNREGGERDKDQIDHRASLKHIGSDSKDLGRIDREVDRWERDKKDVQRDKEQNYKEKDSVRRETSNANEELSHLNEKETVKTPVKINVQEGASSESKRSNHHDVLKGVDRDLKEKKRDREPDSEGDRNEKRRYLEKEPEDVTREAMSEREKENFSHGVQQRRRMLRPRASHSSNREPRFRARARENDGSQGKLETSAITYKVGECMQEIFASWKEFVSSVESKSNDVLQKEPTLKILIPAEHVTATNRQVRGGQLWGTDIYTDDSDLVAVLMHTGYCRPTASLPPSSIQELCATIRVLPPQTCYYSTLRNNVRSRAWGAGIRCSYCVEKCSILKKGGGTLDLEPCLTLISAMEPTLAPVSVERAMTTRSAASNALRHQKFVREVTVQYNLCNEPWVKYSINFVADKGLKKPLYTSARLKKGEVIYLETHFKRYELCYVGEKALSNDAPPHATEFEQEKTHQLSNQDHERGKVNDLFRWSLCKKPLPQEVMRSIGIPLPVDHLEVLEENLEWEEVQWSQVGVWVAGKEYPLARVHFILPN